MLSSYCNDCEFVVSLIGAGLGVRCGYSIDQLLTNEREYASKLSFIIEINECKHQTKRIGEV